MRRQKRLFNREKISETLTRLVSGVKNKYYSIKTVVTKSVHSLQAIANNYRHRLRVLLYILSGLTVLGWSIYGVITYWGNNVQSTTAENHARIIELNAVLQNSPTVDQLETGATAGNADEITNRLQSAVDTIESTKLVGGTVFSLGPSVFKVNRLNNETSNELSELAERLEEPLAALKASKKFLQYDPQSDLAPIVNRKETDPSERVNKTVEGLQTTVDELQKLNTATAKNGADIISPLVTKARSINVKNVGSWYKDVATAQKSVLKAINDTYTSLLPTATEKISILSQEHLKLAQ